MLRVQNVMTGLEIILHHMHDGASVDDVLTALKTQHGISNVRLSLFDRALKPSDRVPLFATLTMVPAMSAGPGPDPDNDKLPFDLDRINQALAMNCVDTSMPANMQAALRQLNCDLRMFYLTLKEGADPPVLQLRVRPEVMVNVPTPAPPVVRISDPAADFVRETIQSTDSASDRIYKDAIRRAAVPTVMLENSTEIVEKLARNVPLTTDEQDVVDRITDAVLTDDDRRELDRIYDEHEQEATTHRARMEVIRARMDATAARKRQLAKK